MSAQEALERNAARYLWLRDEGGATWIPFQRQWFMSADLCDAAIDAEMARAAAPISHGSEPDNKGGA